jgi:hypothetical protein
VASNQATNRILNLNCHCILFSFLHHTITYRHFQEKKIAQSYLVKISPLDFLARYLLQPFPTYGGFLYFPSDGGWYPQKRGVVQKQ